MPWPCPPQSPPRPKGLHGHFYRRSAMACAAAVPLASSCSSVLAIWAAMSLAFLPPSRAVLRPTQVIRLNGGRAFVDGQNLGVTVVLRGTGFLNKAHATVHLHAQAGHFQAGLGAVALDQWHHEFIKLGIGLAHLGVGWWWAASYAAAAVVAMARQPSVMARIVINMRRTSGWWNDGCTARHAAVHRAALHAVTRICTARW